MRNKSINPDIKKTLIEKGVVTYRGFIIKECYDNFGSTYYTIINPKTKGHVHAASFDLSIKICDLTRFILKKPYIIPTLGRGCKIDVYKRANKLAFRDDRDKEIKGRK